MSFSNYIKDNNIFENYRKDERMTRELSHANYNVNVNSMNLHKKNKKKKLNNRILTPSINDLEKRNKLSNYLNSNSSEDEYIKYINNEFFSDDYNSIYKNIISLLTDLIKRHKNNFIKLNKYLKSIYEYIFNIENKINNRKKAKSAMKPAKSDINMVENLIVENPNDKINIKNNRIKSSYEKLHINEINYLVYINELHKKIFNLEKELNIENTKIYLDNKKNKFKNYNKFYPSNDLKIRSQSFTINSIGQNILNNQNLLDNKKHKKKLKISLKDIFEDISNENIVSNKMKLFKDKKYLLSHPRLNFNGYINNNNGKLSNIANEKLNKIPLDTFGVKMTTKLQTNPKSYLYLSFSPTKFKIEGIRSNKNISALKY